MTQHQVTLIPGDGIGPECVRAAQRIIDAAGVSIAWDEQAAGASVFKAGIASGVPESTIQSIRRTRVALKGPLETPVGFGEKSANVTLRKLFETYANIRPVREFGGVPTPYSGRGVDLVIVRENVEDLYAGIEHMQTPGVAQCLKLISAQGSERIVRVAFELARAEGRKSVHCATKANIMKFTEGMLKRAFEQVAPEYPEIRAEHIIVDNCAHQLVKKPEQFEVIVTTNMNGDILSDLTSALVGGLGFAPSANLGDNIAIFEAVHGSAPKYAGKDLINPTAVVLSSVLMLRHLGELAAAARIENAVRYTYDEGGTRTGDVVGYDTGARTGAFTEAVIRNLGKTPGKGKARDLKRLRMPSVDPRPDFVRPKVTETVGADIFVQSALTPDALGQALEKLAEGTPLKLKMISNRGTRVYPATGAEPGCVDHWRCRFVRREESNLPDNAIAALLARVGEAHTWVHVEKLRRFDGKDSFTKAQGED